MGKGPFAIGRREGSEGKIAHYQGRNHPWARGTKLLAPITALLLFEAVIFVLTQQPVKGTTDASSAVTEALVASVPVSLEVTEAIDGGYISQELADTWHWARKIAHIAEFFPVGVSVAWLVSVLQTSRHWKSGHAWTVLASVVICVASLLFD